MKRILVIGIAVTITAGLVWAAQHTPSTLTPLVFDWHDADWGPPTNRPGFPAGIRNAPISIDPVTGAPTYLARFPAGSQFDLHWHTHTETVVVLQGTVDISLDNQRYTATELRRR